MEWHMKCLHRKQNKKKKGGRIRIFIYIRIVLNLNCPNSVWNLIIGYFNGYL